MRIYQQHLPFNGRGEHQERRAVMDRTGSRECWFYIEHRTRNFECIYADEGGVYYYGGKELDRIVPVVWNDRRAASRVARANQGKVKKYPYLLKAAF
jgi:hypothetical protein